MIPDEALREATAVDRLDAAMLRVSKALVGLSIPESELVLGGILKGCASAETDDETKQARLIDIAIRTGYEYFKITIDVPAWVARVRSSRAFHGAP